MSKGMSHQDYVANFGSNASNGTNAGTFYWNLNNSSSNANRNIGTQQDPLKIVNGISSYWGWCKHANAKHLWSSTVDAEIKSIVFHNKQIVKEIQKCA